MTAKLPARRGAPRRHVDLAGARLTAQVEVIAHVCHEANRAWQLGTGDPVPSSAWEEAPLWQRESAVEGVRQAMAGAGPEALHEAWCQHKVAAGWRHGPVKDPVLKLHPCLVPYAELPQEQRAKDALFAAIVAALT
jgi:hypothetical protein